MSAASSSSHPWGMEAVETPLAPLIRNAEATLVELNCGAVVVPMIIPDRKLKVDPRERCSATCMESAAIGYVLEEWESLYHPTRAQMKVAHALGSLASCGPWRRAVQVGSLPFTMTLRSPEMDEALWKVLPELRERLPDRPFIVRTILDGRYPKSLPRDATVLPTWVDYRWDFSKGKTPASKNFRTDRNHFRRSGLIVIGDSDFDDARVAEALKLYDLVYRQRHSLRNPDFTPEFIAMGRSRGWIELFGLVDPGTGKLVGFGDRRAANGVSAPVLFGYDTSADRGERLYRHIISMQGEVAREHGLILNLGSGAGQFKRLRGYLPTLEQFVVFPALRGPRRWSDRALIELVTRFARGVTVESMIAAGG